MALSSAERQKRWRERHPEAAAARLEALKERKRRAREECQHDDARLVCSRPIRVMICHDCGSVQYITTDLADYCQAHEIPFRNRRSD